MSTRLLNPEQWWGWDVETTGTTVREEALMPWSDKGHVISYAVSRWGRHTDGNMKRVYADAYTDIDSLGDFLTKAELDNRPIVGWNVCFDVAWLIAMGYEEQVKRIKWLDGMIIWRMLERYPESDKAAAHRKRYGLKDAVAGFMADRAGYDDDVTFEINQTPDPDLLDYNKQDAQFTLAIASRLFSRLLRENPRGAHLALLTCSSIPEVAGHYVRGLHVDTEYGLQLRESLTNQLDDLLARLESVGITSDVLASPTKLRNELYEARGLPVKGRTPKGEPSTDKAALHALADLDPDVATIKTYRELGNLRTKFVDNVLESAQYNGGTTHPTMNLCSTYTGRATFSSSVGKGKAKVQTGFAIHQMKRAKEYRRMITAPPGHTIIEWDAAGQEYRWMAIVSGDATMLQLCEPGEDPHAYMAGEMSTMTYEYVLDNKDDDPEASSARTAGKVGNLSCQYRIGKESLLRTARVQYGLDWTMADSTRVYNTYHKTYPGVRKYWNKQIRLCRSKGYVETLAGRRVLFKPDQWRKQQWMYESAAVNFPVQGIGADQKYLAIAVLKSVLKKYNGHFYFELHDGIYAVFPDAVAEKAARAGKFVLDRMPYQRAWGFTPPIPLPFDIKLGKNWGDMKELRV